MKILKIIRSKIVIFLIQFVILSIILIVFGYTYEIDFDISISVERKQIIQFLANYIMFEGINDTLFIYSSWILVGTIPIILYRKLKQVYSMNLLTFFFPNFFFYVFLSRYSPIYFNEKSGQLFFSTFILGSILISYSIGLSLIINSIHKRTKKEEIIQLNEIDKKVVSVCPECGTHFDSKPMYCYNCNNRLMDENEYSSPKKPRNIHNNTRANHS